ncbi:hypothetical protein [Aquipseudomonas alcaligenes]|uniref:Uncharacterized protein n=1 Tax=Aquipseudomonas alcaligenes (strain ATCC 14909 / DSM 50342 / CCUG 1425 / JCM 20561 / NBRC 14159 / NCIMB 9945 / NCTC 10367 / 1577) TaxID=1215092 RepID=U2ZUJ7_AQUA1|nr:hypothetical protein [Pseudomonas alcaligenes]GAD64747.1 hypothetical protein PA6_046_00310 [Pseudomonas alcaligenes NBRC 14159]SUD16172.1 Uncharacterised protein [Pseudomonas alcaligenes]SUD16220.1 Uncharacterised protein [Pseudomonas alcaligenes]SUD16247.1 Uncharacterised protein [Pseudomonas alcaligenes]
MIFQGRIICNGCSREMGVLHVQTAQEQHFCPDCSASGSADVLTPELALALSELITRGISRGRIPEVLR